MELPVSLLGWIGLGLAAIITSLTAFGLNKGIGYLKENIKYAAFDALRKWAGTYVAALAQDPSLKGLASEEKKERAMVWIVNKAGDLGLAVSPAEASRLIEEAVWILRNSTLPEVSEELSEPDPV